MKRSVTCGEPERFKNPLCHGLVQGVCFAVLFSAGVQFYSTLII